MRLPGDHPSIPQTVVSNNHRAGLKEPVRRPLSGAGAARSTSKALTAIDVHVHAQHPPDPHNAADRAAQAYFRPAPVPTELDALAAYYRERHIACVLFTVDERLTGRAVVPNDDGAGGRRAPSRRRHSRSRASTRRAATRRARADG